jgi:hypothetical protein
MSRAYRIRVRESLKRVLHAHDRVSTQLELLEVLPAEQMGALLTEELQRRGFQVQGDVLVRSDHGVTVTVNPQTGAVTVEAQAAENVQLEAVREDRAFDDMGAHAAQVKKDLTHKARADLEQQAARGTAELQGQVTGRLEKELGELRQELDQAVNRITAEALKQKAAQIGQIKEMTEDPQAGSLTIVVEV